MSTSNEVSNFNTGDLVVFNGQLCKVASSYNVINPAASSVAYIKLIDMSTHKYFFVHNNSDIKKMDVEEWKLYRLLYL